MSLTLIEGGIRLTSEQRSVSFQDMKRHHQGRGMDIPDWLNFQPFDTTLQMLGLYRKFEISSTPKVAYVGSPLLRLVEIQLLMRELQRGWKFSNFAEGSSQWRSGLNTIWSNAGNMNPGYPAAAWDYDHLTTGMRDSLFSRSMELITP
jgi:hypothetical protein